MFAGHSGDQRRRNHGVVISEGQVRAIEQALLSILLFEMRMGGRISAGRSKICSGLCDEINFKDTAEVYCTRSHIGGVSKLEPAI